MSSGADALMAGAFFSAAAAVAHLACIAIGAPAYRFMGAGERMAHAVEAGKIQPTLITLAVASVLFIWAAYALAGAGVIGSLPFTKLALVLICAVYLGRAVAFPFLRVVIPDNSETFWWVSSGICLLVGAVHLYGVIALWDLL